MKQICIYSLLFLILSVSCQNSQQGTIVPVAQVQANDLATSDIQEVVEIKSSKRYIYTDSIDYMKFPRISSKEYNELQLSKVKEISEYDISYIAKGDVVLSNEKGKIISIYIVTGGEISEYLISYNSKGDLVDSVLVAYEDFVEYYSQVSSFIDKSGLVIQTVNFNYEEEEETSDTLTIKYELTNELRFKQS